MPFSRTVKPPLNDQITEMQRKIQLLERDRTAHYESTQSTIQRNKARIQQLRQENKQPSVELALANSGDESVISLAFHDRGLEKESYCNMSVQAALSTREQSVLSRKKGLNALKHKTQTLQCHLKELKTDYQRMKSVDSKEAQSADARSRKREEDAMNLRVLENSLEKTHLKYKAAQGIIAKYQKFKSDLQEESLTYQGQLDTLVEQILNSREELNRMQSMNSVAQLSKEAAKAELQQLEDLLCEEHKEREQIIASYRKIVEEHKAQAEKMDRRRTAIQPDELSSEAQASSPRVAGEEEKAISTFEEAFQRIKEATGVTHIQEIRERFISQKETHQQLEKLKEENENVLQNLKEQKELLTKRLQDIKYSGETKRSSDDHMLEECKQQLQAQQQRCDACKEHLERLVETLSTIRSGVERLDDKLQHIPLTEDITAEVLPDSEEFVVELLTRCELKLQLLLEELQGKDPAVIMKEMEEEEFLSRIERELPAYNTRVKLPEDQSPDVFQDEDKSEDDDDDIISREALKRQSQLLIDSKSKKKPWKKKNGKF